MMESESHPNPERDQQYYLDLALEIKSLLGEKRSSVVGWIIDDLTNNRPKDAKANCFGQSDKFDNHPEIKKLLINKLFEKGEKHPWSLA